MRIPAPISLTKELSNRALVLVRQRAPRSNIPKVHGADTLYAKPEEGSVGIGIPSSFKYMAFLDKGTKPHLMTELGGKVIPIKDHGGRIHFRYCNPATIGEYITVKDGGGDLITKRRWWNPGIRGTHYIEKSIKEVVHEWRSTVTQQDLVKYLKDSPHLKDIIPFLRSK